MDVEGKALYYDMGDRLRTVQNASSSFASNETPQLSLKPIFMSPSSPITQ